MHNTVQNLIYIEGLIKATVNDLSDHKLPKIIAVSKTFSIDKIFPVIDYGHIDYGENKVQEAIDKWTDIRISHPEIRLHLIGKLQTNKVKFALKIFDYIHSLDSEKLATKIAGEQANQGKRPKIFIQVNIGNEDQKSGIKQEKNPKLFIQVNIGNEDQKSGINKHSLMDFYKFCKNLNLDIVGTMCIPPNDGNVQKHFSEMNEINQELNFNELSMGMSDDYLEAIKNNATYIRIGSKIFGSRT